MARHWHYQSRIFLRVIIPLTILLLMSLLYAPYSLATKSALPKKAPAMAVIHFDNISTEQGLGDPNVLSIVQDLQGFIWVGTRNGLYRYDGFHFKTFKHDPDNPTSLPGNFIQDLYLDSKGVLWVSTPLWGFSQYHPQTQSFTSYQHDANDPSSLGHNMVNAVVEDKMGIQWIATFGGGLIRRDKNNHFSHFRHNPQEVNSLNDDRLYDVLVDSQDVIWVGTNNAGLGRFDKKTGQFKHYQHDPNKADSLSHNRVHRLFEDDKGTLWVGTRGGGINRFNRQNESFTHFVHDPDDPSSLGSDYIYAITEDKSGNLWAGAQHGGLNRFDKEAQRFVRYLHHTQDKYSLADDDIYAISQDQNGLFWLGTHGEGISKFDPANARFGLVKHDALNPNSLSKGKVHAIIKDNQGIVWIGTESGLNRYDPVTAQFIHYQYDPNNPNSLSHNFVKALYQDSAGVLWVGTENGGLNAFNKQSGLFTRYRHQSHDPNSLSSNNVEDIIEDKQGDLWIATAKGINRFGPQRRHFTRYLLAPIQDDNNSNSVISVYLANDDSLWAGSFSGLYQFEVTKNRFRLHQDLSDKNTSHHFVQSIYQSPQGTFWIGTLGGLAKFNPQNNTFMYYGEQEGLSSNNVTAVLADKGGNLWLGQANNGLSLFDPVSSRAKNNIGLQADCSANLGAYFQSADGQLFFGGNHGYCAFYPQQIIHLSQAPKVAFTDFRLLNKSVAISNVNALSPLTQAINHTSSITLDHRQNVLSFEFAALHFADPKRNQYQYQLVGFDPHWIATPADNPQATYTNLSAGEYTFNVKASNHKRVWNEQGRSISLIVKPSPWQTWQAYLFYELVLLFTVAYVLRRRRRRLALILAKNKAELATTSAEKANQAKSTFIANVSHEIRTPLNAILGYTQMLEQDKTLAESHRKKMLIIEKSGHHLLELINDILDMSKIEANAMTLLPVDFELVDLIHSLSLMFYARCREKQLDWQFVNTSSQLIKVHGDQGKLRQVLINLIGNAIKFTHQGSITLRLSCPQQHHYCFDICDSGVGIAQEQQQEIFEAFSQTDEGAKQGGTGLGLAIAQKQVALMGGQLQLISQLGKGSRFFFTLPLSEAKSALKSALKPTPSEPPKTPEIDYSTIRIPTELYQTLHDTAHDYEVSKLEEGLLALSKLNDPCKQFAEHLEHYVKRYDMKGLLEELTKVVQPHE